MTTPGLVGRLVARLHGEVAAHALESYRRAGLQVYELSDRLEEARQELLVDDDAASSTRLALLCGWNALALQTIGDHLLAADYERFPRTVGFVPPALAAEALGVYGPVAGWLSRAQQALHNEHYELDVSTPAPLPRWVSLDADVEGGAYLAGLQGALARLEAHADQWFSSIVGIDGAGIDEPVPGERGRRALGLIRQVRAEAHAAGDYAAGLASSADGPPSAAAEIETQVKLALERLFLYGQLVADPALALSPLPRPTVRAKAGEAARLRLPGEPGFDAWCLTDPRRALRLKVEPMARLELRELWKRDPARTLALKADIDAAVVRNRAAYGVGHFHACPWSAIYVAKQPLRIGRASLQPLQEFTLSIEGSGRRFRRVIEVGPFHPGT
jgi:hypothetical protein